eukprot:7690146-Pyramimonas_sp.AAC.2
MILGGELNSPVDEWLNKGSMTVSSPPRCGTFGECKQAQILGGGSNSPVDEWLHKGLTAVWSPSVYRLRPATRNGPLGGP